MRGDSETEEEEEADRWVPMVEEAMQKHKAAFQEMKMNLTLDDFVFVIPLFRPFDVMVRNRIIMCS